MRADLTILHILTALVSTRGQGSPHTILYEKNERERLHPPESVNPLRILLHHTHLCPTLRGFTQCLAPCAWHILGAQWVFIGLVLFVEDCIRGKDLKGYRRPDKMSHYSAFFTPGASHILLPIAQDSLEHFRPISLTRSLRPQSS